MGIHLPKTTMVRVCELMICFFHWEWVDGTKNNKPRIIKSVTESCKNLGERSAPKLGLVGSTYLLGEYVNIEIARVRGLTNRFHEI